MKEIPLKFMILLFCYLSADCQKKNNSIYFLGKDNYYKGRSEVVNFFEQWGIGFEHRFFNKISVALEYSKWYRSKAGLPSFPWSSTARHAGSIFEPCVSKGVMACQKKVFRRDNYRFADVYAGYLIPVGRQFGVVKVSLGFGLVFGRNAIEDTVIAPQVPPYHYYEIHSHEEPIVHFGLIPKVAYDYFFWKRRISFGVHMLSRNYFAFDDKFLLNDWGFQLGYRF